MSGQLHLTADRQRAHAAGQRHIVRTCSCGRSIVGNAAWWSHVTGAGKYAEGERPGHRRA